MRTSGERRYVVAWVDVAGQWRLLGEPTDLDSCIARIQWQRDFAVKYETAHEFFVAEVSRYDEASRR